jgi:hypothetical protein
MPVFHNASQFGVYGGNFIDNSVFLDNQFHAPIYGAGIVQGNGDSIGSCACVIMADYQRSHLQQLSNCSQLSWKAEWCDHLRRILNLVT